MQWLTRILGSLDPASPQIINDSKTPSGRVHVGALRGVLIHDTAYRELVANHFNVEYTFGVDDYDPLDELPAGLQQYFGPYLGQPLCNVPAPPGSSASDLAEHYITEFFEIFSELGVNPRTYRMRDVYRTGRFNEDIRTILENAHVVRQVYKDVSNSDRPTHWYPFQTLCENCGRIGTTEVFDFDGNVVKYRCRRDLVAWAAGCGYSGSVSPFNGNGKLPWKLEWAAKWHTFGVTIEGAGKDHATKGGSRDVAAACLKAIFNQEAPTNVPYEFFLVGGAKMSSSRGVGASAREIADLLPPEVLRFLILKSPPNRPVNFSPDEEHVVKLFNEFDRVRNAVVGEPELHGADRDLLTMCLVHGTDSIPSYEPPFQLVTTLLQMPHLDVEQEIVKRKGSELTSEERKHLARRLKAARYWLDNYAAEDEKFAIQEQAPPSIEALSHAQRAFLDRLARALPGVPWNDESLQAAIFDAARGTPIGSGLAFGAIYCAFLNRRSGPRAGSLLACLQPAFVTQRLAEATYSLVQFWRDTSESLEAFETWLATAAPSITVQEFHFELFSVTADIPKEVEGAQASFSGVGIVECHYSEGRKRTVRRVRFSAIKTIGSDPDAEHARFVTYARQYVSEVSEKFELPGVHVSFRWRHEDLRRVNAEQFMFQV